MRRDSAKDRRVRSGRLHRLHQGVFAVGHPGIRIHRSITRELEERFLSLCDDHGIPRPQTNVQIEGHVVDFVWRARRLIVEVDGYETDRERDVALTLAGWRVMRFT